MSADLLAEFDSFYQAPQNGKPQTSSTPAINDLSFLGSTSQTTQAKNGESLWQAPPSRQNEDIWGNMTSFQPQNARQPPKEEDIWGSFESMEVEKKAPAPSYVAPKPHYGGNTGTVPIKDKPNMIRRDTLQMFSSNIDGWGTPAAASKLSTMTAAVNITKPAAPMRKSSSGGDILFDADELSGEDDDDFGDFEAAPSDPPPSIPQSQKPQIFQPTNTQPQPGNSQSLEGLFGAIEITAKPSKRPADLSPISAGFDMPYPQAPKSPSFQERNPFANLGVATSQVQKIKTETREASPVTPWPSFEPPKPAPYQDSPVPNTIDEDWGDFADMPPDEPKPKPKPNINTKPTTGIEADAWAWDAADGVTPSLKPTLASTSKPEDNLPPTNIPPPSLLIPLLSTLFNLPQSHLFKPVTNQPFSLKNRILSDPTTITFLRSYLLIATVAAHILAGRKLRWKRDIHLSQAMKIGPSAAGGKSGMKLTGVDRAETVREDREATDLVRVWKEQLGRLKSAVAIANTSIQDISTHLVIPEIGETMRVEVQEGGMAAPKQCVLCGLRREERVAKVDVGVEDSFGEWWVEYWGHRACRNFWEEHEAKLKHR